MKITPPDIIKAPLFENSEKSYIARILYFYLVGGIVISIFGAPVLFLLRSNYMDVAACVIAIVNNLVLLVFLKSGRVKTVSYLTLFMFWAINTVFSVLLEGLFSTPLFGYFAIIPFAGFILGWIAGLIMTVVCIISGYLLAIAQIEGIIGNPQDMPFDPVFYWTSATFFLLLSLLIQFLIDKTFRTILANQKKEIELRIKAQEERKYFEQMLLQKEQLSTIGTFAGGIAHDFNNILSAIIGNVDYIQMSSEKTGFEDELSSIKISAGRAVELVRQILSFSKPPDSKIRLEPCLLQNLIKDSVAMLKTITKGKVTLKTDIDEKCPPLNIDPTHFHQIVTNLAINSYHALSGKENGIIIIKLACFAESIILTVSDNGCGITKENLDRIFDPFFTTKTEINGTGLGLSIVKGMVSRYNGNITVDSELDKGTTFRVSLPVL